MMQSSDNRRKKYGYARLRDYDGLMAIFLCSGKKQIVYWVENIKNSVLPMTYDTFNTRVKNYLRRTKQSLSASQLERIRLTDRQIQKYAQLYLQLSSATMNKAHFFEEYVIVPPYDTVPSYQQFKLKLDRLLKQ